MKIADHPTVRAYTEGKIDSPNPPAILESVQLKQMALAAGADDAGLIDLARDTMADYRQDLIDVMPDTQSVMALVFRVTKIISKVRLTPWPTMNSSRFGRRPITPREIWSSSLSELVSKP